MQSAEATRASSSPNSDLSDAPTSDMEAAPQDAYHLQPQSSQPPTGAVLSNLGIAPATTTQRQATTTQAAAASKKPGRKPREKKESLPAEADKTKEKPKRKPRSDKGTTKNPHKKPKLEPAPDNAQVATPILTQTSLVNPLKFQPQPLPSSTNTPPRSQNEAGPTSQNGLSRVSNVYESPKPKYNATLLNDSPTTLSNMYDPVRSMTVQRPSSSTATSQPYQGTVNTQSQPPSPFHPSTSPAISSIINPPQHQYGTSSSIQHRPDAHPQPVERVSVNYLPRQPPVVIDVDSARQSPKLEEVSKGSPTVKEASPVPEKKPRAKEQPPPLPQGSGLLSSTLFGGVSDEAALSSDKTPSIILHVDLKGKNNNIINFARMAEEKYGFAALHPRLAAQKERLARVAAAGASLERSASGSRIGGTSAGESGDDDGSVDIDRDSGDDGDALMGGMNNTDAGNSGTDGPTTKRRRRKKIEEYDQDDPFVDDSELVWESQAAASKDGFFVYCGPLVPEGEKPAVERADGTVKRGRGRGRGGGVGSRGGRGARANGIDSGTGRATGPGSRGGNITRKPRTTKASREHAEKEKAERAQMTAIAAKPASQPT